MGVEDLDVANPTQAPSHIPDYVRSLAVKLELTKLDDAAYKGIQAYRRAANYIAAGEH